MLRERVDVHGRIRPMEPIEEIPSLRIPSSQIGLIKEAPVRRWLHGQTIRDKEFKRQSKKVYEKRKKFEEKAEQIIRDATLQGLAVQTGAGEVRVTPERTVEGGGSEQNEVRPMVGLQGRRKSSRSMSIAGVIDENRRFGPLDLDDENPPPSAIAKRKDTASRMIPSAVLPVESESIPPT